MFTLFAKTRVHGSHANLEGYWLPNSLIAKRPDHIWTVPGRRQGFAYRSQRTTRSTPTSCREYACAYFYLQDVEPVNRSRFLPLQRSSLRDLQLSQATLAYEQWSDVSQLLQKNRPTKPSTTISFKCRSLTDHHGRSLPSESNTLPPAKHLRTPKKKMILEYRVEPAGVEERELWTTNCQHG